MKLTDILQLAQSQGFTCKELSEKGHFLITKKGFVDTEAIEIGGHACLLWDKGHRYPVQISTQWWDEE